MKLTNRNKPAGLLRSVWRRNWSKKVPKWAKVQHPPVAEARYTILDQLEPLFKLAKQNKLWFWNPSRNLWFSPTELKALHAKQKFIWGPDHWTLRNPMEFSR